MITIGSNGQNISYGIKHYNMDTPDDLKARNPKGEVMGTTCFIISTSKYYMVNGQKEWVEITPFGKTVSSSGGAGDNENPDDGDNDDIVRDVVYDGGEV